MIDRTRLPAPGWRFYSREKVTKLFGLCLVVLTLGWSLATPRNPPTRRKVLLTASLTQAPKFQKSKTTLGLEVYSIY